MDVRLTAREQWWILLTWVVVCLSALLSLLLPRSYLLMALGDIAQCILLLSAVLSLRANISTTERRPKLFWILMSLGLGIWLSVQILWTYFEVFLRREVPNPFVGDVALFLHLVPMMGALAVQPHVDRNEQVKRLGAVDFVLLLVWWLYLYLFVVIPWQYVSLNESLYGRSFDLLYFVEHAVLVICTGVVWRRSTGVWRTIYKYLFGASLLYAFTSMGASIAIDFGEYYTGSFYDVPLVASMACFTAVGLLARRLALSPVSPKDVGQERGVWVPRLATAAILSLPLLAGWALYGSQAPASVRTFRLVLTLAAMLVMGALLSVKQYRLDKELARANHDLREASVTDLLTGARNRRFLTTTIEADVQHALRAYSPNADARDKRNRDLIFYLIDADHFKEINDLYGHDLGDQLLVEISRRISSAIRHSDVLIRWGGEEFLVVSRYSNREDAATLAGRVLNAVGGELFELSGGRKVGRTCSIGWAVFPWFVLEPAAVDYGEILRLADCALYQAKKAGRNQAIGILPSSEEPVAGMATVVGGKVLNLTDNLPARTLITAGPRVPAADDSAEPPPRGKTVAAPQNA